MISWSELFIVLAGLFVFGGACNTWVAAQEKKLGKSTSRSTARR